MTRYRKTAQGLPMDLPSVAVQIVPHRTMTARLPTMTGAAWIALELKAETISVAVWIVQLLTLTWMLRFMMAAVPTAGWILVFHVF